MPKRNPPPAAITAEQIEHALIPVVRRGYDIDIVDRLLDVLAHELAERTRRTASELAVHTLEVAAAQAREIIDEATRVANDLIWSALGEVADNRRILESAVKTSVAEIATSTGAEIDAPEVSG